MNDNVIIEDTITQDEVLPLLRQSVVPLELLLASLIRTGNEKMLLACCQGVYGLLVEACSQFREYNNHEGTIQ